MGIVSAADTGDSTYDAGVLLSGFYETWPIVYPERASGYAETGPTIVPVPDASVVRLLVNGERFHGRTARARTGA